MARMDPLEEKLRIYLKAGLTKQQILEKLEGDLSDSNREQIMQRIDRYFSAEETQTASKATLIIGVVIAIIAIIFVVVYFAHFKDSSFHSEKCSTKPIDISVNGDPSKREAMIEALKLIESTDCEYLLFVADNAKTIYTSSGCFMAGGCYKGQKDTINANSIMSNSYWVSSTVIHEACHSFQHKNNLGILESACMTTEYNYLTKIKAPQEVIQWSAQEGNRDPKYTIGAPDVFPIWKEKRLNAVK